MSGGKYLRLLARLLTDCREPAWAGRRPRAAGAGAGAGSSSSLRGFAYPGDDDALAILQRKLDVDILVTGHTHQNATAEYEGRWFINPGSITGAYSATTGDVVPSFICMSMQGSKVVNYVYELNGDSVEVHKTQVSKSS